MKTAIRFLSVDSFRLNEPYRYCQHELTMAYSCITNTGAFTRTCIRQWCRPTAWSAFYNPPPLCTQLSRWSWPLHSCFLLAVTRYQLDIVKIHPNHISYTHIHIKRLRFYVNYIKVTVSHFKSPFLPPGSMLRRLNVTTTCITYDNIHFRIRVRHVMSATRFTRSSPEESFP
jgi:hypothetical protein